MWNARLRLRTHFQLNITKLLFYHYITTVIISLNLFIFYCAAMPFHQSPHAITLSKRDLDNYFNLESKFRQFLQQFNNNWNASSLESDDNSSFLDQWHALESVGKFFQLSNMDARSDQPSTPSISTSQEQTSRTDISQITSAIYTSMTSSLNSKSLDNDEADKIDKFIEGYIKKPYESFLFGINSVYNGFRSIFHSSRSMPADDNLSPSAAQTRSKTNSGSLISTSVSPVENESSSNEDFYKRSSLNETELAVIKLMGRYSAAAYCRRKKILDWSCGYRCAINENRPNQTQVIDYFNMGASKSTGYILLDHDIQAVVVVFRGSLAIQNFIYDLMVGKSDFNFPGATSGCKVHSGFWKAYSQVQPYLRTQLLDLFQQYPNYQLLITGHSLGGALSVLTSLDMHHFLKENLNKTIPIRVYTFGEPRVGNQQFSDYVQQYLDSEEILMKRVISYDDLIPQLPPRWLGFVHHGSEEIWIVSESLLPTYAPANNTQQQQQLDSNSNSNITQIVNDKITVRCKKLPEDEKCSNSLPQHLIPSHLFYWSIHFGPWC